MHDLHTFTLQFALHVMMCVDSNTLAAALIWYRCTKPAYLESFTNIRASA